ncbi:MAG: VTT domain-containing protein [Bifidobacteriaceae bacterium]|nr:VTT domain-containing protein [Bifidobacteriaceae bacterium]
MGAVSDFLLSLAQSFVVLPLVTAFAAIDGFFPPVPSESVVISLASIYASAGEWGRLALLAGFAAAGAFAGDNIAYWIGHFFQPGKWRLFTSGKGHTAYAWATRQFRTRGAPLLFAARYVPVGRVAVNIVAGSIRFRYSQFVAIDALASLTWGVYGTALGVLGGSVAGDNPLIAIGVGMVVGVGVGAIVQKVVGTRLGMTGFQVDDDGAPGDRGGPPAAG